MNFPILPLLKFFTKIFDFTASENVWLSAGLVFTFLLLAFVTWIVNARKEKPSQDRAVLGLWALIAAVACWVCGLGNIMAVLALIIAMAVVLALACLFLLLGYLALSD
jgi:hypothetical protein